MSPIRTGTAGAALLAAVLGTAGCVVVEVPLPTERTTTAAPTLEEAPDLPAEADAPSAVAADIEDRVFALANDARAEEGVGQLERHEGLDAVARRWSQYLAAEGQELAHNPGFAEQVPEGWRAVGENVGWLDDGGVLDAEEVADRVHEGWMESPGHRENLLQEEYTDLGVGVAHDPEHGYYLTQNFATYP